MVSAQLIDRQTSLLAYLTSDEGIFGGGAPADPMLHGLNAAQLRLEARFSFDKRMAKVRAVFPNTFSRLDDRTADGLSRGFASNCPPDDIGRYRNARQFLGYLESRWQPGSTVPPYLVDIARVELALAWARIQGNASDAAPAEALRPAVRRHASVTPLRCEYDVRTVFDDSANSAEPVRRESLLVVGWSEAARDVRVFEVASALFTLVEALGDWTALAPAVTGRDEATKNMLDALIERGLLSLAP